MVKPFLAALLLLVSVVSTAAAELRSVVVVGVSDGDTITVRDGERTQYRIRLAGIDAPERRQDFSDRSKQHLSNLAFQKKALVDCYKTDQYQRKVCRVWVEGKDVSLAQVQAGLVWHYKRFESEQTPTERERYKLAEDNARASRIGLWKSDHPVPPWEFRRKK